jgi:hypothetical protein
MLMDGWMDAWMMDGKVLLCPSLHYVYTTFTPLTHPHLGRSMVCIILRSRLLSMALLAALLRRNTLALPGLRDLSNEWIGRQPTAAHDRAVSDTCSSNKPVTK